MQGQPQDEAGKPQGKFSESLQCDPCFVGLVIAGTEASAMKNSNNGVNNEGSSSIAQAMSRASVPAAKTSSKAVPCSMATAPSAYLEVEPLMCQMVPERVAKAINFELSMSLEEREASRSKLLKLDLSTETECLTVDKDHEGEDVGDWQTPKCLAGKVAFFERMMKQEKTPKLDPNVKVKAAVSEKVRSAHDQVRTSLQASKVNKDGSGVHIPDTTPMKERKTRVENLFPKENTGLAPPLQTEKKITSTWEKVETALPSSFTASAESKIPQNTAVLSSPSPNVDNLVSEMEKKLDDQLQDLSSDIRNLDDKLDNLNPAESYDDDDDLDDEHPVMEEPAINGHAPLNSKEEENAGKGPASEEPKKEENGLKHSKLQHQEDVSDAKEIETQETDETKELSERSVDTALNAGDLASTESPKTVAPEEIPKTSEESPKPPDAMNGGKIESKTNDDDKETNFQSLLKFNDAGQAASMDPVDSAASTEAGRGETLSRDLATEVLQDSQDADKTEGGVSSALNSSFSISEFPALGETPSSPKPTKQIDKSYARVLAEGKKLEQPTSLDIYQLILSQSPPRPDSKNAAADTLGDSSEKENIASSKKEAAILPKAEDADAAFVNNIGHESSASLQVMKTPVDDNDRSRMEEIAQRLAEASPQKKLELYAADKASTALSSPILTGFGGRSKPIVNGVSTGSNLLASDKEKGENVVATKPNSLCKANFNPYSALTDPSEIPSPTAKSELAKKKEEAETNGAKPSLKKEKAKDKKGATSANKRKKAVRFGVVDTTKKSVSRAKKEDISQELAPDSQESVMHSILQKVNNLVHKKPISFIADGLYWFFLLVFVTPVAATVTVYIAVTRIFALLTRFFGIGVVKPSRNPDQKLAVVVTGCDTGFGRELALSLLREGFAVFCLCLRKESLKGFEKEEDAIPLVVDVTKAADVDKATKAVEEWLAGDQDRYLHALVNNAGICVPGSVDWLTINNFEKMVDVNYYGTVRCCKKFLPLFKFQASRGVYPDARIVNMVSMAGIMGGSLFLVGYEASKHAADVFTTNLRLETKSFGLHVTAVNPSFHKTNITEKVRIDLTTAFDALPQEKQKEYGDDYLEEICKGGDVVQNSINWDSKNVVDAMRKALVAKKPPARILVGSDARYVLIIMRMLPTWITSRLIALRSLSSTPAMMKRK